MSFPRLHIIKSKVFMIQEAHFYICNIIFNEKRINIIIDSFLFNILNFVFILDRKKENRLKYLHITILNNRINEWWHNSNIFFIHAYIERPFIYNYDKVWKMSERDMELRSVKEVEWRGNLFINFKSVYFRKCRVISFRG